MSGYYLTLDYERFLPSSLLFNRSAILSYRT